MRYIWIFLISLAQLGGCTTRFLSLPLEAAYPERTIAAGTGDIRYAAGAGDDLVVVSGPPDTWKPRTFTRVRGETSEPLLTLPEEWSWCGLGSEAMIAGDDGNWWYSRCAGDAKELFIRVVSSAAPSSPMAIPIGREPRRALGWLPIEGKDVAGVFLSRAEDGQKVRADLVTPSGAKELGVFDRDNSAIIGVQTWQAHKLDENRVALVSIELDSRVQTAMVLLRLFEDGKVTESRLAFAPRRENIDVASTMDGSGQLAIVAPTNSGVEAMIVDPRQPTRARARLIADVAASAAFFGMRIIPTRGRFVAAWLRASDRTVQLCELDQQITLAPVSAGSAAGSDWPFLALRRVPDGIDVLWTAERGVGWRHLPEQATGYLLAADLWIWLKARLHQMGIA